LVRVLGDRGDEIQACLALGTRRGRVRRLEQRPAVVPASRPRRSVDLLPEVLADVGAPQLAGLPVEAHAPRVAQAPREDLRPRIVAYRCDVLEGFRTNAGPPFRASFARLRRVEGLLV